MGIFAIKWMDDANEDGLSIHEIFANHKNSDKTSTVITSTSNIRAHKGVCTLQNQSYGQPIQGRKLYTGGFYLEVVHYILHYTWLHYEKLTSSYTSLYENITSTTELSVPSGATLPCPA
jgi:hypothetical protein